MGKYLSIWGVRAIFPAGFLIDGGTFVLFGLLQWVEDKTTFLVFSYLIRFIEVRWIEKCCAKRPTLYGHIVLQCFLPYSDPSYSTNSSSLFHYFFDLIKISFFSLSAPNVKLDTSSSFYFSTVMYIILFYISTSLPLNLLTSLNLNLSTSTSQLQPFNLSHPQGVGAAATWTSNLSILMAKFPDRKASVKVCMAPE